MIADPITLLQCCHDTDGAAAVVMASVEVMKKYAAAAGTSRRTVIGLG